MTHFKCIAFASLLFSAGLLLRGPVLGQQPAHSPADEVVRVDVHADELGKDGVCADKKLHDYSGLCATTLFPLKIKIVAFAEQPRTATTGLQCHPNGRCDTRSVKLSNGQMVMTCLTSEPSCQADTVFVLQAACGTLTVPFYSRTKCAPLLIPEDYRARSAASGLGFEILTHTP